MIVPGHRVVRSAGARHFYDGRRVVSLYGDTYLCSAVDAAVATPSAPGGTDSAVGGAHPADRPDRDVLDATAQLLERLGVVQKPSPPTSAPPLATAVHFEAALSGGALATGDAEDRLRSARISVVGDGAAACAETLRDNGLRAVELADAGAVQHLTPAADLVVGLADAELPTIGLLALDAACRRAGVSWIPVNRFDGAVVRIGPLVLPGETACFECTTNRLAANVDFADVYRQVVDHAPSVESPPAIVTWSWSILALLLLRWLAARDAQLPGTLFTLRPDRLDIRADRVFRVPRCHGCGCPDYRPATAPWETARAY